MQTWLYGHDEDGAVYRVTLDGPPELDPDRELFSCELTVGEAYDRLRYEYEVGEDPFS